MRQARCLALLAALALFLAPPGLLQATPAYAVSGRVVDAVTGQAVPAAEIRLDEETFTSDAAGQFRLVLPSGTSRLEVAADGYAARSVEVEVKAADVPDFAIGLVPRGRFQERLDVVAQAEHQAEAPATVPVRPSQVVSVAGGAENVFRVLQTLPGVAGTDEFGSRLSVRGGGPDENLTVMDGVEVYNPYRLFGLVSAFNPETVESFELTAGAFSARYGDRLSSLLVVENRAGSRERALTGSAALSLTDTNLILEGRLPKDRGSWLLSGRRTYYDLIGERFTDSDLPSFDDLQSRTVWDLGRGRSLALMSLRSRETTDATFRNQEEGAEGALWSRSENDVLAATFQTPLGSRVLSRTIASWYENTDSVDFGGDFRNEGRRSNAPGDAGVGTTHVEVTWEGEVRDWALRQELTLQPSPRHVLEVGAEAHRLDTHVGFTIPGERNPTEANASSLSGGAGLPDELDSSRTDTRIGAWVQDRIQAGGRLVLEPGLRADYSGINRKTAVCPRLLATLALRPSTRLRLGLGTYTQSPGYEKLIQSDYFMDLTGEGALSLDSERSHHAVLGLEHDLAPGLLGRVEAYYKRFDRLIVGRIETPEQTLARVSEYDFPAELAGEVPSEPWITTLPTNDGRGLAWGFDVYLARRAASPGTRLTGWASYTFGVADTEAYGRSYPCDYDRRHALSAVGSLRIGERLELSATARLASGFPRTPAIGLRVAAVPDENDLDGDGNRQELIPERDAEGRLVYATDLGGLGNLNSARFPFYARLDARATYTPNWGRGRVKLYLDVINVTNRHNAGFIDATLEPDPASDRPRLVETEEGWIPFLPSFGVHVAFSGGAPRRARTEESSAEPPAPPSGRWALAGRLLGTQGLGLDLARSLSSRFNARLGFGLPSQLVYEDSISETDYEFELALGAAQALLDWYPVGHRFHVTAGALGTRHRFELQATQADSYEIGQGSYSAESVGSLTGEGTVRRLVPYFGLGWGNAFGKAKKWALVFDLGVAPQGTPSVDLAADGPAATAPEFLEDLERERLALSEELDRWRLFPVISLSVSRRF